MEVALIALRTLLAAFLLYWSMNLAAGLQIEEDPPRLKWSMLIMLFNLIAVGLVIV